MLAKKRRERARMKRWERKKGQHCSKCYRNLFCGSALPRHKINSNSNPPISDQVFSITTLYKIAN
jgi:hypothetical protein